MSIPCICGNIYEGIYKNCDPIDDITQYMSHRISVPFVELKKINKNIHIFHEIKKKYNLFLFSKNNWVIENVILATILGICRSVKLT